MGKQNKPYRRNEKMIKKLSAFLMVALLMVVGAFGNSASASTGPTGSCGVSVYTDATTYSTSATTVDWKASKGSTCGTVYYKMRIFQVGDGSVDIGYQTSGSFSSSTPLKSVYISDIKNRTPYPGSGAETYKIVVYLYSSSSYTTSLGSASSNLFYIN
jgi:hypothetical protein